MGLASDIKAAKGYITNTPERVHITGSGHAPCLWYGDDAVDGTAVLWAGAPVGSLYVYKASESATPTLYFKFANNAADTDWGLVSFGGGAQTLVKQIPITDLTDGENDTAWDLPAKAVVLDVLVEVTTAEATAATKTIDIGLLSSETGGDADGFVDGISTAATGVFRGTRTVTTGSNTKFFAASPTRGAYLADHQAGTDVDQDEGVYSEKPHVAGSITAKSVTFTLGAEATELAGNIYIVYILLGL
jgi:hypothetical protein